jgi:hypothetical protein
MPAPALTPVLADDAPRSAPARAVTSRGDRTSGKHRCPRRAGGRFFHAKPQASR